MEQNAMIELASRFSEASLEDVLELFNPINAQALPEEVLSLMPNLTDEQIEALALRYPNAPTGNTYLVLKDTKVTKQLYNRSTWANLHNLRTQAAMKNFVAFTFSSRFKGDAKSKPSVVKYSDTQDLTKEDATNLEGLKKAEPQKLNPIADEIGSKTSQEGQGEAKTSLANTTTQTGEGAANTANFQAPTSNRFIDDEDGDGLSDDLDNDDELEVEESDVEDGATKINTRGAAPKKAAAKKAAAKKAAPKKAAQ